MKKNNNIDFYINIGFATFIFVLTISFLNEFVFPSSSIFVIGFSGLVGAVIGFVFVWKLKNKSIVLKIIVLLVYVSVIAVFAFNRKKISSENNSITVNSVSPFQGNWSTKENELTLKLVVSDKTMVMNFYPDNKRLYFDYEMQGQTVDFFNDKEGDDFQWKILKLTSDSLVVMEKEQILRFAKEQ